MSTQSIKEINMETVCKKTQSYLKQEGINFIHQFDLDLKCGVDYDKLKKTLIFKEMLNRCNDASKVINILNKTLN